MPKSTLLSPNITDIATDRAVSNLYKQVNKLLSSFQVDADLYQNDILEGTVRAIYDTGLKSCRLEAKTPKGWVSVPAQLKTTARGYTDLFQLENSGDLLVKSSLKIGKINPASISLDRLSNLTLDVNGDIELNADGGQITIKDDTATGFTFDTANNQIRIHSPDNPNNQGYFTASADGVITISTQDIGGQDGHLTLDPDGQIIMTPEPSQSQGVHIDFDTTHTTNKTCSALYVDTDQTGIIASGQTLNITGIDSRVNTNSPTMVGTVNAYGIKNAVTCGTSGVQTAYGLWTEVFGGDTNIGLHIQTTDGGTSDIKIVSSANVADYCTISTTTNGETTIATVDADSHAANLTLDVDGTINFDSEDGVWNFKDSGTTLTSLTADRFNMFSSADQADFFRISIGSSGETTLTTVDDGAAVGHLKLVPDGDLILDPASQKTIINATDGLYFDGGGDTYLYEPSADVLRVIVGGDILIHAEENGDDGNRVYFPSAAVGFNQVEPTYNASTTIVDFRFSNKQFVTFGSGNITNMNVMFPDMSGNFQLLLKQDGTGSRTVTNWKAMEFDESAADGSASVVWAGGSAPTLTTDANHVDILSFYWDADNEIAYGVATLDFQF